MSRRQFLKTSGLLSLTPLVPGFVNQLAAATQPDTDQKILVVVEMNGGNDGINTLVPHRDELYRKYRPKLALATKSLHKITDSMALHSSMKYTKEQFDDDEFAIINGVSYPNPNRSHFESQAIWHSGLRDKKRENGAGWIGRALDLTRKKGQTELDGYFVGRQAVSAAMIGRRAQVAALSRFSDLQLDSSIQVLPQTNDRQDIVGFVQRQVSDSYKTARRLESAAKKTGGSEGYSRTRLSQQLRLVSRLIRSGSAARVYYTIQDGYDTHSTQPLTHLNLLQELSISLKAFVDDMKRNGLDDRVIVLAFSEFGRRVRENRSRGTDHGTAGPVFLTGTPVKGGFYGKTTDLSDLEDGDLKSQFDFRQIYASILDNWLNINSKTVLHDEFKHLDIIRSS